jgi:hypothetical protein
VVGGISQTKDGLTRLFGVKGYEGASSTLSFDEAGDVSYPLTVFRIEKQAFVEE